MGNYATTSPKADAGFNPEVKRDPPCEIHKTYKRVRRKKRKAKRKERKKRK